MIEHDERVVRVERVIPADAATIFDVLADPTQHPLIDGSGSVRQTRGDPPERLALGSTFGMRMRIGLPYSIRNEVIEFEEGRRIAWQTRPPSPWGWTGGGRIWRYELEPVDGATRVRESWDISQEAGIKSLARKGAQHTATNMEKTLERIEEICTK